MTTIAYKDGILVGDTLITMVSEDSPHYKLGNEGKVYKVKHELIEAPVYFGCAGDDVPFRPLANALSAHFHELEEYVDPFPDDKFNGIVVYRGESYFLWDCLKKIPMNTPYCAVGSGTTFALGAMASGATAVQAVEAAARMDLYTGFPLQGFNTNTGEELSVNGL